MKVDIRIEGDPEQVAHFLREMNLTRLNVSDALLEELRQEAGISHVMESFPIEELELGIRSYNCLKRVGIETIGDLMSKTEGQLSEIPNLGKRYIQEIEETLATHGLRLRYEKESRADQRPELAEIVLRALPSNLEPEVVRCWDENPEVLERVLRQTLSLTPDQRLERAIEDLPEPRRGIVKLYFGLEGEPQTPTAIGQKIGKPPGAVGNLCSGAVNILRKNLGISSHREAETRLRRLGEVKRSGIWDR